MKRERDRLPDHALHGRGRPRGPAHRGDRSRPHRGAGSPAELKEQTSKESLEEAFLALTGTSIRDESAVSADQMRQMVKMWRR